MTPPRRILFLQDGARLHYALPLALHRAGLLERVYTDWYSAPGRVDRLLAHLAQFLAPQTGQRMLARHCQGLPLTKVLSRPWQTLRSRTLRRSLPSDARWLERSGLAAGDTLFGFVRHLPPRLLEHARNLGLTTIADQMIAPRRVELREQRLQNDRFPGWSPAAPPNAAEETDEIADLEARTWSLADHLTCPSAYVREGLQQCAPAGLPTTLLPYPFDGASFPRIDRARRTGPVTVGFLGTVGLRKGAPSFFEVARRLAGPSVRFEMVGPVDLTAHGIAQRGPVELTGPVPRNRIAATLGRFDVLLFPSTCEGSAQVIGEALLTGLPVVCSRNSGSPEAGRLPAHSLAYDDIEGFCAELEPFLTRKKAPPEVTVQSIETYGQAFVKAFAEPHEPAAVGR
jgi:glycosyltransferase involved in cell wall biosynthesis